MDDTVYITNGGDTIAVDQTTGVRRWTFTPADFSPLTQTPAIANGVVYVTGGSSVFALDQATDKNLAAQPRAASQPVSAFRCPWHRLRWRPRRLRLERDRWPSR